MMEKISSIDKIFGNIPDEKKQSLAGELSSFYKESQEREPGQNERSKTAEDVRIINFCNDATNRIRNKFGFKNFDINPNQVIIIKDISGTEYEHGVRAKADEISHLIETPYHGANFQFALEMFHEMLHLKSYHSLLIRKDGGISPLKTGLRLTEKDFLFVLDEAVVSELSANFIKELYSSNNSLFAKEIEELKSHGANVDNLEDLFPGSFGHLEKRNILNTLISKIQTKLDKEFVDKDEIFDIFAKAIFEKNVSAIKNLLNKAFGEGTFKEFIRLEGEREQDDFYNYVFDLEKLKQFIERL